MDNDPVDCLSTVSCFFVRCTSSKFGNDDGAVVSVELKQLVWMTVQNSIVNTHKLPSDVLQHRGEFE